jgi:hypothetical protein
MDEHREWASDEMLQTIGRLFEAKDHSLSRMQDGSRPLTAVSADKVLAYLERRPLKDGWVTGPQGQPMREGERRAALLRSAAATATPDLDILGSAEEAEAELIALGASARAQAAQRPHAKVEREGIFEYQGVVYKVVRAIAMGDGHLYAKRFSAETKKFVMARGMLARLSEADRVTAERAAEFGRLYGTCMDCGRDLTDEESIAAGRGRICRQKLGESDYYSH